MGALPRDSSKILTSSIIAWCASKIIGPTSAGQVFSRFVLINWHIFEKELRAHIQEFHKSAPEA